jgi:hypothetical protein
MEQGTPAIVASADIAGRVERNEVLLAFRSFVEQVRLGLREGHRLVRRLIEPGETSSRIHTTSSPTPLVSVPLVVLAPTTDREQIELDDLAHTLGAAGYEVAPRGAQWVVYTEIPDRRKLVTGGSAHDRRGFLRAMVRETIAMESETRPDERGSLQLSHEHGGT